MCFVWTKGGLTDKAFLADVGLAPAAHVVALGAADEAALRVPERGLAVVAPGTRDIGALAWRIQGHRANRANRAMQRYGQMHPEVTYAVPLI